jgi:hypothetical protein
MRPTDPSEVYRCKENLDGKPVLVKLSLLCIIERSCICISTASL